LEAAGLKVRDVVVLVDRQQGGRKNLTDKKLNLHAVLTLDEFLKVLHSKGRIKESVVREVQEFIKQNQTTETPKKNQEEKMTTETKKSIVLSYEDRISISRNSMAKKLLQIISEKKTNLSVSADVTSSAELLQLADELGPYICCLKTHIDIIEDFTPAVTKKLQELAKKHNFLLFEDRKFADIGNTVSLQFSKGIYRIADWADFVNAHVVPGPGIIQGLRDGGLSKKGGVLLLAEMSSKGTLATGSYTQQTVEMAKLYPEIVMGFITQHQLVTDGSLLHLTPGVQFKSSGDSLGQQYDTPYGAIFERGTDVIIVGRGIIKASDRVGAAKEYRQAGWDAYVQRLSRSRL